MAKKNKLGIPGFPDKWTDKLPGGADGPFVLDVNAMELPEMRATTLECADIIDEAELDMSEDAELAKAKEDVKLLGGAYRDTLGCQKAKIKYIIFAAKQRGYNLKKKVAVVPDSDEASQG